VLGSGFRQDGPLRSLKHRIGRLHLWKAVAFALGVAFLAPARSGAQLEVELDGKTFTLYDAAALVDDLRHAEAGTVVAYENAVFQGSFHLSDQIDTVRAALQLRDVRFMEPVSFDWSVFAAPVDCERVQFEQGASLLGATFLSDCKLADSRFGGQARFKRVRFAGEALFDNSVFERRHRPRRELTPRYRGKDAIPTFIEAEFGGRASFDNSLFGETAYFERCRFLSGSSFVDVNFRYGASFKEGVWEGPADFSGSLYFSNTFFQDAVFQDVSFEKTRFAGNVSFSRAEFAGETTFRQAALLEEANFDEARFRSYASFTNGRFPHRANFREAVFDDILFLDAHVPGALDLRHANGPHIDLRPPTTVAARRAHNDTTTKAPRIYLQDARFDRMVVDWPSIAGGRLAAEDTASVDDLAPVYSLLRQHLQFQGLDSWAADAQVEWLDRRLHSLTPAQADWYFLHALDLTTRYGTQPLRAILFALLGVVLFGLLYYPVRASIQAENTEQLPALVDCFHLSLSAFVRLGWSRWRVTGKARLLVLAEGLLGLAMWGLFVTSLVAGFLR